MTRLEGLYWNSHTLNGRRSALEQRLRKKKTPKIQQSYDDVMKQLQMITEQMQAIENSEVGNYV